MEDKQLNLNQPLLSVRRHSSTTVPEKDDKRSTNGYLRGIPCPPPFKSELKSGPVGDQGAVPFVWEQSPGRPKDESKLKTHTRERPPTTPKLPPGRILKDNQQDSDDASADQAVNKIQFRTSNGSQSIPAVDEYTNGLECYEDAVEEDESSGSGGDEEVYEDARDTLSRTESFFLNCSVSGIGLDDVKPCGNFSKDPQARDFMIGRFLPAAKAMASETPQHARYAPKKQPKIQDQPRQIKKVVNGDKRPQLRYGPSFVHHYSQSYDNGEEESDDDCDEHGNLPAKVCGLLPRFCLKSSLCLLNPLPAMSARTRAPMSPASRAHTRSSSAASSWSKTENEHSSFDTSEQRSIDGFLTAELHEEKNDLNYKPKQISSNFQKLEGQRLHGYYQGGGISQHPKESSLSYEQRPVKVGNTSNYSFSSHGKSFKSFKELLADQNSSEEDLACPAVEKTLYVDTVHKRESLLKESYSFNRKGLSKLRDKDNEIISKGVEENLSKDSSLTEKLSTVNEGDKLQTSFQKSPKFVWADEPYQKIGKEAPKVFRQDQNLYQDAIHSANIKVPHKEATRCLGKQTPKTEKLEKTHGIYSEFPIPPPLPKSPSDSWLWRTLPSISSKNSSLHPQFGTGNNPGNRASVKWETKVKTELQQQHFRYSEDLLAPIPEN